MENIYDSTLQEYISRIITVTLKTQVAPEIYFSFDYLRLFIKMNTPCLDMYFVKGFVDFLASQLNENFVVTERSNALGLTVLTSYISGGKVSVIAGQGREGYACAVDIPGQVSSKLTVPQFFQFVHNLTHFCGAYTIKCTRIDLALDDYSFAWLKNGVFDLVKNNQMSNVSSYKIISSSEDGCPENSTLYIGSRRSAKMLRCYMKSNPLDYHRIELEAKKDVADKVFAMCTGSPDAETIWALIRNIFFVNFLIYSSNNWYENYQNSIKRYITTHFSHKPTNKDLLRSSSPVIAPYVKDRLQQMSNFLHNQAARTFYIMYSIFGDDLVKSMLESGKDITSEQKALLNTLKGLHR